MAGQTCHACFPAQETPRPEKSFPRPKPHSADADSGNFPPRVSAAARQTFPAPQKRLSAAGGTHIFKAGSPPGFRPPGTQRAVSAGAQGGPLPKQRKTRSFPLVARRSPERRSCTPAIPAGRSIPPLRLARHGGLSGKAAYASARKRRRSFEFSHAYLIYQPYQKSILPYHAPLL